MFALTGLGNLELQRGNVAGARGFFTEVIELADKTPDGWRANLTAVFNMAVLEVFAEEYEQAGPWLVKSLELAEALGNREMLGYGVGLAASLAAAMHDFRESAQLLGASASLMEAVGASVEPIEAVLLGRAETSARKALGEQAFDEMHDAGTAVDPRRARLMALRIIERQPAAGRSTTQS